LGDTNQNSNIQSHRHQPVGQVYGTTAFRQILELTANGFVGHPAEESVVW